MPRKVYEIYVGNIGLVDHTYKEEWARKVFQEYIEQSKSGVGRASSQDVILMFDGEVIAEYVAGGPV